MAKSISIVVPFYRKKKPFKKVFSALLMQLENDDEIIVVDDHSPSGVAACGCMKELTIIKPPKLTPHIYRVNTLRNLGVLTAKHDAVGIIDPDCIPNENWLYNARRIFDPSVLFAGRIDYLGRNGNIRRLDPRAKTGSRWLDNTPQGGVDVWGGCMLFSKGRAELVGLFDDSFNGSWGADDCDFADRCYHSGLRLRYEPLLAVKHQYHPKVKPGHAINVKLWKDRRKQYFKHLNTMTPYNPTVGVLIATLMRPRYIDQVMRAVFRAKVPIRVRLVNQGDHSSKQIRALHPWWSKWAVDFINNGEKEKLSVIRTQAMKDFSKTYKYMITMDDDILPTSGSIEALLRAMKENPQYHAIAGGVIEGKRKRKRRRMLGGYIQNSQYYNLPQIRGVAEVDFVSSGFTACRLKPPILYDVNYEFGWNDWDWANEIKKAGKRLAVCGEAMAYHRRLLTARGFILGNEADYVNTARSNSTRHQRSAQRFEEKWGYAPKAAKYWEGPVVGETL